MKSPNDESRRYPKPVEGYTATYRQKLETANALETLIIPVFKQIAAKTKGLHFDGVLKTVLH